MQLPNLDPVKIIEWGEDEDKSELLDKFNTLQSHYEYLRKLIEIYGTRVPQPYTWQINFDSTYSAEVPFWMPTKVIKINNCKLKIVGSNYRGYSGDVTVGGSGATGEQSVNHTHTNSTTGGQSVNHLHDAPSTGAGGTGLTGAGGTGSTGGQSVNHIHDCPTTSSGGTHDHSQGSTGSVSGQSYYTGTADGHYHSYVRAASGDSHTHSNPTTGLAGSHTHPVGNTGSANQGHTHTGPSHTHTGPSHTHTAGNTGYANVGHIHTQGITGGISVGHTHAVGTHDHGFTLAIIESTDPTGVNVYIDNGTGYGASIKSANSPVNIEMDIKQYLSIIEGWKKIKVTSTRKGRANITLILDTELTRIE